MTIQGWLLTIGIYCIGPAVLGAVAIPAGYLGYWLGFRKSKPLSWREESHEAFVFMLCVLPVMWLFGFLGRVAHFFHLPLFR